MSENRLNNSLVLYIYKEKLDNLSHIDIGNNFVDVNERRISVLGMFKQVNLRKCSGHTKIYLYPSEYSSVKSPHDSLDPIGWGYRISVRPMIVNFTF